MAEPLRPGQLASQQIELDAAAATAKLAEMKATYDAANEVQAISPERTAIDDVLSRTSERSTLGRFLKSGNGSGAVRQDEIAVANEWERQLLADAEMQKRLLAGDPDMLAKCNCTQIWAPGPHEL